MIQRLITTLPALARGAGVRSEEAQRTLVDDCADAVRLELDCPQQELTAAQRVSLRRVGDVLEGAGASAEEVAAAARDACAMLGIAIGGNREGNREGAADTLTDR